MVVQGDALQIMRGMESGTFDALITDPPYSSGGMTKSERTRATRNKYIQDSADCPYPDFENDSMDPWGWRNWAAAWMREGYRLCRVGAPIAVFCDWRQYEALANAMQWGGWTWRGVAVWDKTEGMRPQPGRPRQQAEFVLWGSKGPMSPTRNAPVMPGVYRYGNVPPRDRAHQTQKPLQLMRDIMRIVEPGGRVLDPFCGSGTTLEAARLDGYDVVGIELVAHYAAIAEAREWAAMEAAR